MKTAGNNLLSFYGRDGFKRRFASGRVPPKTWAAQSRRPFFFAAELFVGQVTTLAYRSRPKRILVLERVERDRFRRSCSEDRATGHFLVEVGPHHFGREREVLDGSPAGDRAELRDVEVGIAGVVAGRVADRCLTRMAGGEGSTISALGTEAIDIVVGAAPS